MPLLNFNSINFMFIYKYFATITFFILITSAMKQEEIFLTKQEKEICQSISFDTLLADI
jgi:hypothetical protein